MIVGIGTDLVTISRMSSWITFPKEILLRCFTEQELITCTDHHGHLITEKLAVRFAAKEACFKALNTLLPAEGTHSFLRYAAYLEVKNKATGAPFMVIDWQKINPAVNPQELTIHLSLSHEKDSALAFVIIEKY